MKLISWWGCGKIDQPLISGDKIVEFGIAAASPNLILKGMRIAKIVDLKRKRSVMTGSIVPHRALNCYSRFHSFYL
jgi:hypothetical protein